MVEVYRFFPLLLVMVCCFKLCYTWNGVVDNLLSVDG